MTIDGHTRQARILIATRNQSVANGSNGSKPAGHKQRDAVDSLRCAFCLQDSACATFLSPGSPYPGMSIEAFNRTVAVVARWFNGGILCFFAFIPGWILFHAVIDAIGNPRTIDWRWIVAVAVCALLMYFLLLIAFRAFTGRGRKQDGGLLPPIVIQIFAAVFAMIGAAVSALGLHERRIEVIFGGLAEFLAGAAAFRIAGLRRKTFRSTTEAR